LTPGARLWARPILGRLGASSTVRFAGACLGALAVFLLWIVFGASGQVGVAFLYVLPVGMATWWFDWRVGLGFALACICLYVIGTTIHPVEHFGAALTLRAAALLGTAAGIALLRRRMLELETSEEELEAIRMALTPPSIPAHTGIDVAAAFSPSELGVSGDFYLLTNGPDGATIAVVGDVVGHGPKAARLATFIRARLASFAANSSDPAEILNLANDALLERPGRGEELVSAVCLRFHAATGSLSWAIAGHPPPLALPGLDALHAPGRTRLLGVGTGLSLAAAEVSLTGGSGVVAYTDGATDVRVEGGAMLGLEGLRRMLGPVANLPAEALVGEIEESLIDCAHGTIRDDICVLVLRPAGGLTANSVPTPG
jgi:serine phosphatase RsbU (regulator of sigma subunit)